MGSVVGYWPLVSHSRRQAEGAASTVVGSEPYLESLAAWALDQAGLDEACVRLWAHRHGLTF
jgi:hypothetical protein